MDRELESLLIAYDAWLESGEDDAARREVVLENLFGSHPCRASQPHPGATSEGAVSLLPSLGPRPTTSANAPAKGVTWQSS
jgi:hypothetical protein